MEHIDKSVFRHNYLVNVMDGGFFGFALGLASFGTVIPLFVSTMTTSALLIGLIPAIHNVGWQLPQLLLAPRVGKLERLKPMMLAMTTHERLPFLGLAIVAWFTPRIGIGVGLILTFVMLVWQGLGGGFAANPWMSLMAKVIPGEARATFFGIQSAAAALLGSLGAAAAGIILNKLDSPFDFTSVFLMASISLAISFTFCSRTIEHPALPESLASPEGSLWQASRRILRQNKSFRRFVVMRNLSQFCVMAFAFYAVYAVRRHGMNEVTAGLMTSVLFVAQVIANPVLGWLADRWGRKEVLGIGAACGMFSALVAFLAPNVYWFFLVVFLAGIASTAFFTIGITMMVEFSEDSDRPTYIGLSNTLVAPSTILAPLFGGWLADLAGFSATFAFAAMAGVATLAMVFFMDE